jgi:hypothetical protein
MTEQNDRHIQVVCISLIRTLDKYMDSHNGQKEAEKLAVTMSALTKVLATMAASMGMPQEIVIEAIKADMELAHEAMAEDETKH